MASDSHVWSSPASPNKRFKTPKRKSIVDEEPSDHQHEFREQQQSSTDGSCSMSCGICLSDAGKLIRGQIDSCNHYFCFVCIMEWARVESRCPMCKRRFTAIRRPPKDGVFPCERVVNVPQRDQVYHLFGNATTGPFDPFAQIHCSVCHSMTDESLLLLCDLCDLAAHTYCVGLGHTVPEDDWFCHDCAVSKAEHKQTEIDTDSDNQNISGNSFVMSPAVSHVSIVGIVQELNSAVERPLPRVGSLPNCLSPPVSHGGRTGVADEVTRPGTKANQNIVGKATESFARTLQRCRNVHSHVRALRENWDALRNGSLRFSSSSVESCGKSSKKHNGGALVSNRSGQSNSSSSSSKQATAQDDVCGYTGHIKESDDIDKAWKMMDIAKSMKWNCKSTSSICHASKIPFNEGDVSKQSSTISSSFFILERQQFGTRTLGSSGMEKQSKYYSQEKEIEKHRSQKLEKQKQSRVMTVESSEGLPSSYSPGLFESPLSKDIQTRGDVTGTRSLVKNTFRELSNMADEQGGSSCLIPIVGSALGPFDSSKAKLKLIASSSSKVAVSEGKLRFGKGFSESKARRDDDAKSEIQSLVKLNLKLLSKDKILGVDVFKEVARLATHTILAACGLEHPKSCIPSFPGSICSHTGQIQQLHVSTLMPNSCRECFYVFVKDVVHSILFEKVGHFR